MDKRIILLLQHIIESFLRNNMQRTGLTYIVYIVLLQHELLKSARIQSFGT